GVFEEQGFAGARIEDIAARAGVAVPTVYKIFTNKPTLLVGALNQAMAGDGNAAIDQQAWFTEQLDEPDAVRQLQLIARNARRPLPLDARMMPRYTRDTAASGAGIGQRGNNPPSAPDSAICTRRRGREGPTPRQNVVVRLSCFRPLGGTRTSTR